MANICAFTIVVKFQNTKTGKYLNILPRDGGVVTVTGGGGKWTRFRVKPTPNHSLPNGNSFKFESVEIKGKYVAVQPQGVAVGTGGKFTLFSVWGNAIDQQQQQQVQYVQPQVIQLPQQPMQGQQTMQVRYFQQGQQLYIQQGQQLQQVQYVQQQPQAQYPQPQQSAIYAAKPQNSGLPPPSFKSHQQKTIYEKADEKMNEPSNNDTEGSDTWTQPKADAKGTCAVHSNFNDSVATEAAKELRTAMKGLGTDKKKIVEVTARYNAAQRKVIRNAFRTIDQVLYNKGKERNLRNDLNSELGGNFRDLVLACYEDGGEYDARLVHKALAGMGYNSKLLIEVLCTRTNKQINAMQSAWTTSMKSKKSMKDSIFGETKKTFSGNNFQHLVMGILEGKRPANSKPNDQQVQSDAEILNRMINQEKKSDAKAKFVEVFTQRSWAHIAALSERFMDVSKKWTLDAAIKKAFGDGSDTSQALRVITSFASQPYDYWAQKLRDSMKGMGTNDDDLIRIVVTRCEIDMVQVKNVFGQRYGNGKTLKDWIVKDVSGNYRKLLLLLCGYE